MHVTKINHQTRHALDIKRYYHMDCHGGCYKWGRNRYD